MLAGAPEGRGRPTGGAFIGRVWAPGVATSGRVGCAAISGVRFWSDDAVACASRSRASLPVGAASPLPAGSACLSSSIAHASVRGSSEYIARPRGIQRSIGSVLLSEFRSAGLSIVTPTGARPWTRPTERSPLGSAGVCAVACCTLERPSSTAVRHSSRHIAYAPSMSMERRKSTGKTPLLILPRSGALPHRVGGGALAGS